MKSSVLYWVMITILGVVHLHMLFNKVPIDLTCIVVIGLVGYLAKTRQVNISTLGNSLNGSLFVLQVLLSFVYVIVNTHWFFILFIGIEVIRWMMVKKLTPLLQELKQVEEQHHQMNETFRRVRSERHDFLKHISAVHFLLETDSQAEAKHYLDELVEGYEETNLSIKGERGTVAGVLHQMYRRAQASGIDVVYDLDLPLSTLPVPDKDIVILIGNLLSNSIDACEQWQQVYNEQAMLSIQFYKRSGLYLLICKNKSLPVPANVLDGLFKKYGKTTKGKDHEGLGTKLIADVVSSHHGLLDFIHKDEEFTVKIKIPAIRS
ncbi:GHKL domain-containing protein [Peribacillus psychrosaccharolyticus]|uniref:sensor histidine kinase n=1 Tax=Peribacillus psychrosaccharolyticus TaxID=1407 RepID=UPI003D2D12F0